MKETNNTQKQNEGSASELYKKIFEVQGELDAISKDKENPFFNSSYFDINSLIAVLKPALRKHKLAVLQPLTHTNNGEVSALTTMIIDVENGTQFATTIPLPETKNAQQAGSAITYFRRYALQSLFLLQAQDDDANLASNPKEAKQKGGAPF